MRARNRLALDGRLARGHAPSAFGAIRLRRQSGENRLPLVVGRLRRDLRFHTCTLDQVVFELENTKSLLRGILLKLERCKIGLTPSAEEDNNMLQWKNPRFLVVLALLASLAVSFGSWGWDLSSWGW